MAARTALEAMDAATADAPVPAKRQQPRPASVAPEILQPRRIPPQHPQSDPPQDRRGQQPRRSVPVTHVARAAATATQGFATPLKRASRALWHELTGSFFALFALSFLLAAWKTRSMAMSTALGDRYRFGAFCAVALLFGYFSISSFLRARRT